MRLRSDAAMMACAVIAVAAVMPRTAAAQEGAWSFSAGGGYAYIFLSEVKGDMDRDVKGYNNAGLLLPPFPSPSSAFIYGGKADYRFDRDYSFSLSLGITRRTVGTSWKDGTYSLHLNRTIGSTTVLLGLAYHFPTGFETDLYGEVQLGYLFAKATSAADWIKFTKVVTDTTGNYIVVEETLDDTRATFSKSKIIVAAAFGGTLHITGPLFVRGEAAYRFGQIGKIDGQKTQFGQTVDQTTSIEFDLSGVMVTASIGIEFD